MSTTVSVVIPCYNAVRFLGETLESVRVQTYPPLEVIVVDDGSADNSHGIAESFGGPVRVIRQTNQGESVARNRGIAEAKGEWIAFLDADDLWSPDKLRRQVEALTDNTVAVCTAANILDTDSGISKGIWTPATNGFNMEAVIKRGCPCQISSLLVRADLPVRFHAWTRYAEDALYCLDLAALVAVGAIDIIPDPLVTYRRHSMSQLRSKVGIEVEGHRSLDRWIVDHSNLQDGEEQNRLRRLAVGTILNLLINAYRTRHWQLFDIYSRYLNSRRDIPGVEKALSQLRFLPKWLCRVQDRLRGIN